MFTNVIVRKPGQSLVKGITSANLGQPVIEKALEQHNAYIAALASCGVTVTTLEADERFPDSVFVEDTAVLTPQCAVITNPGAASRQGEETAIKQALKNFYEHIETIEPPGTLEGGDVMMVGDHFYTGLSARTNGAGLEQFRHILEKYGYKCIAVPMREFLHLKTGLAYLENNHLLITGEFIDNPIFAGFNKIVVEQAESYAANSIWVNDTVIMPAGYRAAKKKIAALGYRILEVDTSEFKKLDGGVSCMSLRF